MGTFVILMSTWLLTGCTTRYGMNRIADLGDIVQFGVGITAENPKTGMFPPSLGLLVQATEALQLGIVHFTGLTAEQDGRGVFIGPESRTRAGIGPYQWVQIDQDYENGIPNYFKMEDSLWTKRMNSRSMRFLNRYPAKELDYTFWTHPMHEGWVKMPRGYQYWESTGFELSLSEPFVTHQGINLKFGIDLSEVFDFLLGFTTIDFKRDDLTQDEFDEMMLFKKTHQVASSTETPREGPGNLATPENAPIEGSRPTKLRPIPEMLPIYFDFDKYNLRADQVERAQKDLEYAKSHPDVKIQVEGNCDERGTIEYNFHLGENRGRTMMEYFIKNGIAPERLRVDSKGEENPVDQAHNEEAWAKNRRDEFLAWE